MKRKNSRSTVVLGAIVGASLLAAVLGYLVLVSPQRSTAADLAAQAEETRAKVAEYRLANRNAPKPFKFAELFALTKVMPDDEDVPGVLLELSRVAADSGIEITSVMPKDRQPAIGYQRLPLVVTFRGQFYELSDFLYRLRTLVAVRDNWLEADGRLFTVDKVDFVEGPERFPDLEATLLVTAFVFDSAAISSTDGAAAVAGTTPPAAGSEGAPTAVGAN